MVGLVLLPTEDLQKLTTRWQREQREREINWMEEGRKERSGIKTEDTGQKEIKTGMTRGVFNPK